MNKFEKVTVEQYCRDVGSTIDNEDLVNEYYDIKIPQRATKYSAGYDFYSPFEFYLDVGETIKIPTGIKCQLDEDKFLAIYPRSGLGFKFRLQLDNTIGVVDSDYYNNSNNQGHIFIKISNVGLERKRIVVKKGEAFAQGIITQYFVTNDDISEGIRNGGIGSTSQSKEGN